jgi:uncharacterized protein HemY
MHALTHHLPGLAIAGLVIIVLVWLLALRLRSLLRWARELTEWEQEEADRQRQIDEETCGRCEEAGFCCSTCGHRAGVR